MHVLIMNAPGAYFYCETGHRRFQLTVHGYWYRNEQLERYWGLFAAQLEALYEKLFDKRAPSTKA